jgi:hypothetical protein
MIHGISKRVPFGNSYWTSIIKKALRNKNISIPQA